MRNKKGLEGVAGVGEVSAYNLLDHVWNGALNRLVGVVRGEVGDSLLAELVVP